MVMRTTRPKKTVDDYLRLPDDVRVELIDGEFFVTPAPRLPHQDVILRLGTLLQIFVKSRGLGKIVIAPFDCVLSNEVVVQPDLLFIRADQLPDATDRLYGPPDVAIEVLSPTNATHDRIVKRNLYEAYGVPEYWIVDPDEKTVEVMHLREGRYELVGIFEGDDRIESPTFPNLDVKTAAVFD